jgi:hypothetical protein
MSETTETAPQGGADPAEPAAPVITGSTEAPAPADTGAATETTETTEQPKPSRADRRIAALSARLSAGEQERARLAQELDRFRRGEPAEQQQQYIPPELQPVIRREVEAGIEAARSQERVQAFHAAGRAAHADWAEKCQSLIQMGADAGFSQLLVETPEGHKVAAALADEPEELERITALRSDRARAIELGKFAAKIEGRPAPPRRALSQAPPPIRPIGGSRTVEPSEATMTAQQLVDFYSKQALEARMRR